MTLRTCGKGHPLPDTLTKTWRVVQLTSILLMLFSLHVCAGGYSQTITFSGTKVPLEKVFTTIEAQTGMVVVWNRELIDAAKPVTADVKNIAVDDFLSLILKNSSLDFLIEKQTIIVTTKSVSAKSISPQIEAPPITVRGKIVNERGEGVVASVTIKGTGRGTTTDNYGNFELTNVDQHSILIISGITIETQEKMVSGQEVMTIVVEAKISTEDEVEINAGYYTVKDRERTGNISKVSAKEIAKQPVTNVMGALIGRVPGLEVVQSTGTPGGAFTVRIRGQNSIAAGNDPMYIVDGVPFSSESIGNSTVSRMLPLTGVNPLNSLNPNDILSIEILKDADATAIYGSRGANGVILITTKKGKAGKTKFDMQATMGASRVTRFMDLMNTEQYLAMRKEAFANDGITEYPAQAFDVNGTWSQTRYTDLQKELIGGTARNHNIQGSISGGSEFTQFLVRGSYQQETTIFPGDFKYRRVNTLVNLTHRSMDNRFKMTLSNTFSTDDNNVTSNDLSMNVSLPPNVPEFYNPDGTLNWENNTWENPLAKLNAKYDGKTRTLNASASMSYEVIKDLSLRINLGYSDSRIDEINAIPSTVYNPMYQLGSESSYMYQNNAKRESWIIEPQLAWQKQIGEGLLQVLAGTTFQQQTAKGLTQMAYGFASNSQIYDISSAAQVYTDLNINTVYKYQALFGRVNYAWKEKYIMNLTARYDGSSRFGPGKQFASFGAAGAAWIFSQESWLANAIGWLSLGKIRASYGITGNDQIGDYEYLDTYGPSYSVYQVRGLAPQRLYNPDFAWETNKKLEAALELGFFKDRLYLSVSWYRNRSSNQLVGIPLSAVTGFPSIRSNFDAVVQNTGVETELRTTNIQRKKFTWTTTANVTVPRNKLVAFPGIEGTTYANQYVVGYSLSLSKLYNITGFDPATGILQVEDIDKDGNISSPNDRKFLLDRTVEWYGGLGNTLTFGNWQADIFFQFTKQTTLSPFWNISVPGGMRNQVVAVQNRWLPGSEGAVFQPYTTRNPDILRAHTRASSGNWALEDRSYIRLRNLSVSYRLTAAWMKNWECRFFAQGQNLLTFTKFQFADPEPGYSSYVPPFKTLIGGIQLTF